MLSSWCWCHVIQSISMMRRPHCFVRETELIDWLCMYCKVSGTRFSWSGISILLDTETREERSGMTRP